MGASLTGVITRLKVLAAANSPSLAVTFSARVPLKLSGGVPEKVPVNALKLNQLGRAVSSDREALSARVELSTSLKVLAGRVKFTAVSSGLD